MYVEYFYWHYIVAPRWLAVVLWRIQQAIIQFFSVPLILRTLFAHWHRDAVSYKGGTISSYLTAFAWNQISRAIGFIVRTCLLAIWLLVECVYIVVGVTIFIVFLTAPFFFLFALVVGILQLI